MSQGEKALQQPSSERARQQFLELLADQGAALAPGAVWRGSSRPLEVACAQGHTSSRTPGTVRKTGRVCGVCPFPKTARAHQNFLVVLASYGASPAPGATWQGALRGYPIICAKGHQREPWPANVQQGSHPCAICANRDTNAVRIGYEELLIELGAKVADDAVWRGVHRPYSIICPVGHAVAPHPSAVKSTRAMCRICSGNDPQTAHENFLRRVAEQGARPAPGATWRGALQKYPLICAQGHQAAPLPASVQQGQGLCDECAAVFDRVYLLEHPASGAIKVGVAGVDARVRRHLKRGYQLVAQWTGLEHSVTREAEVTTIAGWRTQGAGPVMSAPKDGRTETASSSLRDATVAALTALLGPPTELHLSP